MHVIIIGCGKVGSKFARVLSEEGHDVVIVDSDSNSFKALDHDFNGMTVTGVPIDQDVLKQAGIETADALAAVTPDDNINIMACQVAKEIFKVPKVIARIYNPAREHVFHQFGLQTICPTNLTVDVIRSMILDDVDEVNQIIGNATITYKHEKVNRKYEGKKLASVKTDSNSFLFGVVQNGQFSFPNPDIKLNRDDVLIFAQKTL